MLTFFIAAYVNPNIMNHNNLYLIIIMLPMYLIAMPLKALLIHLIPAKSPKMHKMIIKQWFIAFLMCYAIMELSNLIGQFITMFIGMLKGSMVSNNIVDIALGLSPWVSTLLMVLLVPIAEEILFRKLLIDRTLK